MTKTSKPATTHLFGTFSLQNTSVVRLFYASVCLFVAAAVLLVSALAAEYRVQHVPTAQVQSGFKVGTKISMGLSDVTVTAAHVEPGTGVFETPGKAYAVVTVSITNRSEKPFAVIPTTDLYIKDASGVAHYITPYKLTNPFHAGELPPGDTIQGDLSYLVPQTGSLKLYVDSSWSGGVISYAIR